MRLTSVIAQTRKMETIYDSSRQLLEGRTRLLETFLEELRRTIDDCKKGERKNIGALMASYGMDQCIMWAAPDRAIELGRNRCGHLFKWQLGMYDRILCQGVDALEPEWYRKILWPEERYILHYENDEREDIELGFSDPYVDFAITVGKLGYEDLYGTLEDTLTDLWTN